MKEIFSAFQKSLIRLDEILKAEKTIWYFSTRPAKRDKLEKIIALLLKFTHKNAAMSVFAALPNVVLN